jgi:hypothetical protein
VNIKRFLILLFLIFTTLFDRNLIASDYKINNQKKIFNPEKKELLVGENLIYRVELFGIPIGWINLKIKEKLFFKGHNCYHIVGQAYTNRFFKKFYDVIYNVDTYIDTGTLLPYRFQKQRILNGQITEMKIDFDWEKRQVIISDEMHTEFKRQLFNLNDMYNDLLSSLYYFRLMEIKSGRDYNLNIFYGQNNWTINIKVKSPELIDLYKQGSIYAFVTEITTDLSQIILGTPKLTVYFSNDIKRIPLLFYIRIPFGPLRGKIYNLK